MRAQSDMPLMPYSVGNKEGHQDIPSPPDNRLFKQFGMGACPDKNHHSRLARCFYLVDQ